MTDSNWSGHREPDQGSGAGGRSDPGPARGPRGAGPGSGYSSGDPDGDEQVTEGEVIDGEVIDPEVIDRDVGDGDPMEEVSTEIIDGTAPELDAVSIALAQRDEFLDSLRRLQAEFENYKKRVAKQQADQMARAALSLVDKVLPVLDTLDLATEHLGDAESADGRALVAVASQLHDVLAKEGLERIDPIGEEFDPNAHEAVGHLPAEETGAGAGDGGGGGDDGPGATAGGTSSGEPVVGQVMRPGYRWRGTVVRPAMVMVRG